MQIRREKHFLSNILILLVLVAVILTSQSLVLSQVVPPDEIEQISWSPDGNYIAVAGGSSGCDPEKKATEYAVRIVDAATGEIVNRLIRHNCRLVAVDWSPDGSKIASSSFDGKSYIWNVQTGQHIQYLRIRPEMGLGVVWSPDSMTIASIGSGGNYAMIWSAATGELLFNLPADHTAPTTAVVWKPNGTQIATSALDNTIRIWDVASQQALLTLQSSSQVYWVDWHPDGHSLVSANQDGTIQIWNATNGHILNVLHGHTDSVEVVFWSPDGNRIASGSLDETVRIWDVATGEQIDIIQSNEGAVADIAWSPDGSHLAYIGIESGSQNNIPQIVPSPPTCNVTVPQYLPLPLQLLLGVFAYRPENA